MNMSSISILVLVMLVAGCMGRYMAPSYSEESQCPPGVPVFNCFADPCMGKTCSVPGVECRSDYCGGCNTVWVNASEEEEAQCRLVERTGQVYENH